ncbi:hypothetical protein K466DRAFT_604523 [Polyporus arcularius HHB13444]|uniref:Secreted protein n=1 Tax=Polyporus arcularius HHB13444 TaxID=1314778 RepID=A0A5C3P6I3_9APHY|nr:hypothetical protein K466DRAFT_604523 [Polyporus arcularius HHB13444]
MALASLLVALLFARYLVVSAFQPLSRMGISQLHFAHDIHTACILHAHSGGAVLALPDLRDPSQHMRVVRVELVGWDTRFDRFLRAYRKFVDVSHYVFSGLPQQLCLAYPLRN